MHVLEEERDMETGNKILPSNLLKGSTCNGRIYACLLKLTTCSSTITCIYFV